MKKEKCNHPGVICGNCPSLNGKPITHYCIKCGKEFVGPLLTSNPAYKEFKNWGRKK